jgi:cell division protein FtsB
MRKLLFGLLLIPFVSQSQNVGIGTTTPAARLDVKATSNYVAQFNGVTPMYMGIFENDIYRGYLGSFSGNDEDVDFGTGSGTTGKLHLTIQANPRLTINNVGNVGIGTVNPIGRLDVQGAGTGSSTNTLVLRNSLGDTLLRMRDDGRMGIGYNGSSYGRVLNVGGAGVNFYTANEVAFGGAIFPTDTSLVLWSNSGSNNYLVFQPSWGNTGIGTYTPNAKLHLNGAMLIGGNSERTAVGYNLSVAGKIIAEEVKVQLRASWPDYVFADNYQLMPIEELEKSIKANRHLPNIPSAARVNAANGIELGEMNRKLVEKVEELTLYIIQLKKENKSLQQNNQTLEQRVQKIEEKLAENN